MTPKYNNIAIGGGDTAQPLALGKRMRYIRPHIRAGSDQFLDCGCGSGDYVFQLVDQLGLDAYGIEYAPEKVRIGRMHPEHGHRISQGDVQAMEFDSNRWDYAMLNEVLEHVPDDLAAVREVFRILKPGGTLFLFSPNRWHPFETHGVHHKRSGRQIPPWVPLIPYIPLSIGSRFLDYWARNYWQSELRRLVASQGFSIIDAGFIWQTFEGISGRQPKLVTVIRPWLRSAANFFEAMPPFARFGLSQVLICRK